MFHFKQNFVTKKTCFFVVVTAILVNFEFVNCPANTALLFLCYDNLKQLSRNDHNF